MRELATRILHLIERVGADGVDTEDVRLQKAVLVSGSIIYILTGALWGLLYFASGQRLAGIIPISYAAVSLISIILNGLAKAFGWLPFGIGSKLQAAALPVEASAVQASESSQVEGQDSGGSQVSLGFSTAPLPQLTEQSLSIVALQPAGQQPSRPLLHSVML